MIFSQPLIFGKRLLAITAYFFLALVPASGACKVKAIFVRPPEHAPDKAILVAGKKLLEIELPQQVFSDEVELPPGDMTVAVLAAKPQKTEIPPGTPSFKIPETWTDCVLLFFHDPTNKVFPAKIIPVNTSTANFPLGDTIIFNVSAATVIGKFGTINVQVRPGQSTTIKPPRSGSGSYPVAIDCTVPGEKTPIALCRSNWQYEALGRQFMFVTPMAKQKYPNMWGVLDSPAPVEKAKND